jgi:hypothetical protein
MAWLEKRGDSFHLSFRLGDQKFKRSLKTRDQAAADTALVRAELLSYGMFFIPFLAIGNYYAQIESISSS